MLYGYSNECCCVAVVCCVTIMVGCCCVDLYSIVRCCYVVFSCAWGTVLSVNYCMLVHECSFCVLYDECWICSCELLSRSNFSKC
jgi:hypothetical protein